MNRHVTESDLALFLSGDLGAPRMMVTRVHLARCERCRRTVDDFRADRDRVRNLAGDLPASLDWDRAAAEMTANIHLGLAAGECVAPRRHKSPLSIWAGWRPAAIMAGAALMLAVGWWLNMPRSTTEALGRALTAVVRGHGPMMMPAPADETGMVVAASDKGIELRENGGSLGISEGSAPPITVSLSVQGSASARYVDPDTGQMAITSVYGYAQ
jgi:anti-sigma factor RsiW